MKWLANGIVIFVTLLFFMAKVHAEERYTFDPNHSYVLWHISHFGFSNPSGKWMIKKGNIVIDKENPKNSKVTADIDVANMITGIPELDKHLQGQLFFDTKKFPAATFVSDSVDVTSKTTAEVQGTLTVHGVSKPVTLQVKLNKIGINPITNKETIGFSATTTLKRSDFGMKTLLPGLGDAVTINIEMEANK